MLLCLALILCLWGHYGVHVCACARTHVRLQVLECRWKTNFCFEVKVRTGRSAMLVCLTAQRTPLPMIHSNPEFGQSRCHPCQSSDLRPSCPEAPEHNVLSEACCIYFPFYKAKPSSVYKNGSGLKFKRMCGKNLVDCRSVGTKMRWPDLRGSLRRNKPAIVVSGGKQF